MTMSPLIARGRLIPPRLSPLHGSIRFCASRNGARRIRNDMDAFQPAAAKGAPECRNAASGELESIHRRDRCVRRFVPPMSLAVRFRPCFPRAAGLITSYSNTNLRADERIVARIETTESGISTPVAGDFGKVSKPKRARSGPKAKTPERAATRACANTNAFLREPNSSTRSDKLHLNGSMKPL